MNKGTAMTRQESEVMIKELSKVFDVVRLLDEGKIDEAENRLYEMTCDGDRQNLEIGLLFYYELNGKDDEFLEANNFSREEIMMGIQDLADRYNLSGIAEAFRTEIL